MLKKLWDIAAFLIVIVSLFLSYFSNNYTLKITVNLIGCFILIVLRIMLYVSNKRKKKIPHLDSLMKISVKSPPCFFLRMYIHNLPHRYS